MPLDWSREFDAQHDRMEADKSALGIERFTLLVFMLKRLQDQAAAPTDDTAMIKHVRQSRKHQVWRVSHPYRDGVALRLGRLASGSDDRPMDCRGRNMTMSKESGFVPGNDRLRQTLKRTGVAEAVAGLEEEAAQLDRTHAMSLAMIREAGKLTQTDIARALKITQGAVSQVENRGDVLLSTLRGYLAAAGATDPRIVVSVNGHDVVVDLGTVIERV